MKDGHPYHNSFSYDEILLYYDQACHKNPGMTAPEIVSIVADMTGLRHSTILNALPSHVRRSMKGMA